MFKKLIFSISLLFGLTSFAGDKVGNGGGLWTCTENNKMISGLLVDLYEAREEFGLRMITTYETDPMKVVQERSEFIRMKLPEYSGTLNKYLSETFEKIRMVNSELVIVDDALFRLKPPKSSCNNAWVYTQFANFTNQNQVLVRHDLWQSQNIDVVDKAALIWHEAVYKWLRDKYQDKDSVRARQIVGYLFSTLSPEEIKLKMTDLLVPLLPPPPPPPTQKSWICQIYNSHNSTYFADYGLNQTNAKAKTLQKCKAATDGFFCNESSVKCDEILNSQAIFSCQVKNNHISQVYVGEGRSLLEAEYKARNACQATPQKFFCESQATCE